MGDVRQGIHFDMDTKALEKYYPKESWRMAYDDVRGFLEQRGFEHEQGSGYHSVKPMTQAEAVDVLEEMINEYPWLNKCVRICTVADVPITFDFSNLFDKSADIPERNARAKAATEPEQPTSGKNLREKQSLLGRLDEAKKQVQSNKSSPEKGKGKNNPSL